VTPAPPNRPRRAAALPGPTANAVRGECAGRVAGEPVPSSCRCRKRKGKAMGSPGGHGPYRRSSTTMILLSLTQHRTSFGMAQSWFSRQQCPSHLPGISYDRCGWLSKRKSYSGVRLEIRQGRGVDGFFGRPRPYQFVRLSRSRFGPCQVKQEGDDRAGKSIFVILKIQK
jgi:hypothetical protein